MKDIHEVLAAKMKEYSKVASEINCFRYVLSQIEEPADKKSAEPSAEPKQVEMP